MPRILRGNAQPTVLPPQYGGTGQSTLAGLKSALSLVDASVIGAPDGYASLNTSRKIPAEQLAGKFAPIYVIGPSSLIQGASGTYTIKNYDDGTNYDIVPNSGTLTRVKDVITYTPSLSGARGFTINGANYAVNVGVAGPIGSWGNGDPNPAGASIPMSSSPGVYRKLLFGSAGGRVTSCSITQPADLPAGTAVRAEVNYSEGYTGVYVEFQGTMPADAYTGTCQLTVTTEAQPGDTSPTYPVGTQTQPVTISCKRYYFSFSYGAGSYNANNGSGYTWDIAARNLPNGEIVAPYQFPIEIVSGSLPPGMFFQSGYQGVGVRLTGTPNTDGNYGFTIRLRPPTGWVVNPAGTANAYQDMNFSVNVTTPVPKWESLVPGNPGLTTYKLASGTKTFRVSRHNTAVPNPYEWKIIDGNNTPMSGWNLQGVAPGDGKGYIDVTQTPSAPLLANSYTNIAFTYSDNDGAFFASTGLYAQVLQAHFTMSNLGPSFTGLRKGITGYRNIAQCNDVVEAGSVALLSGSLPPGMSLSAQQLVIAGGNGVVLIGTPSQAGTFNFTYRCTGGSSNGYHFTEGPIDFSASVQVTENFTLQSFTHNNSSTTQYVCAISNTGNITSGSFNSLPAGCTSSINVGALDARITCPSNMTPGTYNYTLTLVTNSGGSETQSGTFTVTGPSNLSALSPVFTAGVAATKPAVSSYYGNITGFTNVSGLPAGASLSTSGSQLLVTTTAASPADGYQITAFITTTTPGGSMQEWYSFGITIIP